MKRDKTLKMCVNHDITPTMELKPDAGSNYTWVWNTQVIFAEECPNSELLATCFLNDENPQKLKM
ncbi:hypothetical protein A6R68_15938, partial [Neotoma lepida]